MNWERVISTGVHNRMATLLWKVLHETGRFERLQAAQRNVLEEEVLRLEENALHQGASLKAYLNRATERGLETVVHKGLYTSINLYGDAAMRPGGDIDILVRKEDVTRSLEILDQIGIGRNWPNLLDDRYYTRHHLHQQRSTPDLKIWFEVHWALDHPYTLLTIDYPAMLDRAAPGTLLDEPVLELTPPDLLLSLAVHLVKHAIYLPSAVRRRDLARIILADGMLMYYLDVAEVLKKYAEQLDWRFVVRLAKDSGGTAILGAVLQVCRDLLAAPIPGWVLQAMETREPGWVTRGLMNHMVEQQIIRYMGGKPNPWWDLLVTTNGAFILRPIRALDLAAYFFPGAEYLRRRYRRADPLIRLAHLFKAAGEYTRLSVDSLYFGWERHKRLKALNQSTSLFNRLEVDT